MESDNMAELNKRIKHLESEAERLFERGMFLCREADWHGPYTRAWNDEIREINRQEDAVRDELQKLKGRFGRYGLPLE